MQRRAYVNVGTKEIVRVNEIAEGKHIMKRCRSNLTSSIIQTTEYQRVKRHIVTDRRLWESAGRTKKYAGGPGLVGVYTKKRSPGIITMSGLPEVRRRPTLPTGVSVPSARAGLTSLFGMGRGGTPRQEPPRISLERPQRGATTSSGKISGH